MYLFIYSMIDSLTKLFTFIHIFTFLVYIYLIYLFWYSHNIDLSTCAIRNQSYPPHAPLIVKYTNTMFSHSNMHNADITSKISRVHH